MKPKRLGVAASGGQHVRQTGNRGQALPLQGQGLAERTLGVGKAGPGTMNTTEPAERADHRIVEVQRLAILRLGLFRITRLLESQPVVGVGPWIFRCELQGAFVMGDSLIPVPE
jgi:hypothetical protein